MFENIYKKTNEANDFLQESWTDIKKEVSDFLLDIKDERHIWLSSAGEKFKIELILVEDEEFNFKKNITTHTLENGELGTSGSVPEPFTLSIRATVGELYWEEPDKIKYLDTIQNGLNTLSVISPSLSTQAQQYMNKANNLINTVNTVIDKIDNILEFVDGLFNDKDYKEQKKAYAVLKNLFLRKYPIKINTFFGVFENMSIKDLSFKNNNLTATEITITLQEMNFKRVKTRQLKNAPIAETQKAESVNNGTDRSVAKSIYINNI